MIASPGVCVTVDWPVLNVIIGVTSIFGALEQTRGWYSAIRYGHLLCSVLNRPGAPHWVGYYYISVSQNFFFNTTTYTRLSQHSTRASQRL